MVYKTTILNDLLRACNFRDATARIASHPEEVKINFGQESTLDVALNSFYVLNRGAWSRKGDLQSHMCSLYSYDILNLI